MCDCDDNPAICGGSVSRKARKPHKCSECWRAIAKGETYTEHSGLWRDGGWQSFKWCAHCQAAQKIVAEISRDYCYCFERLWEDIADEMTGWGCIRDMTVYRMIVGARRQWKYRRGPRKGELVPIPAIQPVRCDHVRD